jgi:hypothetical protein
MVREYDLIRRKTGCRMNMDLHRSAIPTGSGSVCSNTVSPDDQARWIIRGRSFRRIIVENPQEIDVFKGISDVEVIHVSELAEGHHGY